LIAKMLQAPNGNGAVNGNGTATHTNGEQK